MQESGSQLNPLLTLCHQRPAPSHSAQELLRLCPHKHCQEAAWPRTDAVENKSTAVNTSFRRVGTHQEQTCHLVFCFRPKSRCDTHTFNIMVCKINLLLQVQVEATGRGLKAASPPEGARASTAARCHVWCVFRGSWPGSCWLKDQGAEHLISSRVLCAGLQLLSRVIVFGDEPLMRPSPPQQTQAPT